MTRRVIDNFRERLRQCVDNNGSHLTDLIFKTYWNKMALYVLFENKNTFLFLYFICLLLNLQICQIILTDSVLLLKRVLETWGNLVSFRFPWCEKLSGSSIDWIIVVGNVPDTYLIMLSVKKGGVKYHFFSLWYDSNWDWTPVI